MTIEDAINNLKRGKCIPYKHETLTLVIKSLEAWEKLTKEIEDIYEEEVKIDVKWAQGFKYSLKIIDKHLAEVQNDD